MTLISRRFALHGAAALVAAPAILRITKAHGAEFSFKYANNSPMNHPLTVRPTEAAEAIAKETNGKVEIKIFPNSQLGGDTDMLAQLRSGALEFFTLSPLILSVLVPKASINGIGFAWSSYDKVWPAMDGDLGAFVRGEIQKSGLYAFEKIFDNGFRQITSSTKPIKTADDLKGFKIRVPVSPLWTSMFKAFDSAPLSINWAEVYSSLQTRIADGQENPLAIIDLGKIYEVQKYLSVTNHMWDGFWFLTSQRFWNKLPSDVKQVIEKHVNQAAMRQREDMYKLNTSLLSKLKERGMEISEVDTKPFRAKLQSAGFYKEWKEKFGPEAWALLEKHTGAIS
ncbi:TRAP transporter substrate-binding protein [Enterovirga rhinocerotis]|uniref:Tripartite ATP-independent transporter DctP family solute receptor n=1 Tax=Enterovirga rhinocerotis TaxID=1339210 RepID=A0A4R7C0R4_9HYPH|nr:TRAP transporter substrate-binding protein [Enterovirga rhinocerotis]TDR89966.1 tripartite ATP-independent transporter DctP family solute receptor [Enterovirga rhinocerotis]